MEMPTNKFFIIDTGNSKQVRNWLHRNDYKLEDGSAITEVNAKYMAISTVFKRVDVIDDNNWKHFKNNFKLINPFCYMKEYKTKK